MIVLVLRPRPRLVQFEYEDDDENDNDGESRDPLKAMEILRFAQDDGCTDNAYGTGQRGAQLS